MAVPAGIDLSVADRRRLDGHEGEAARFAMDLLLRVAEATGSARLIDVSQAHLVGCYDSGPANLGLVEKLAGLGARVVIPTTLNASDVDLLRPTNESGAHPGFQASCRLVRLLERMGCRAELTCAPYHLPDVPGRGECVAWAESNAVVYANSVLGARTNRAFQYLDLCAALTGRMPEYGLYLDANRRGRCLVELADMPEPWLADDSFYQLLGLHMGGAVGDDVPVIAGLPDAAGADKLRGLGAAAASSGSLAMFHAVGLTPEAPHAEHAFQGAEPARRLRVAPADITAARDFLRRRNAGDLAAVCMGTPHASVREFETVHALLDGRRVHTGIRFHMSTSRHVLRIIEERGLLADLQDRGVGVLTDTCTYYGALLDGLAGRVMTNSAKWAYYAPGNLGIRVQFATTAECVESAVAGETLDDNAFWAH